MHPVKHRLLINLDKVTSKINRRGSELQYVSLNSTTSKLSFPEHYAKLLAEYHLIVMVLVKSQLSGNIWKRKIEWVTVEEIHLFKNDGEDVKEFWFTRKELENYLNTK